MMKRVVDSIARALSTKKTVRLMLAATLCSWPMHADADDRVKAVQLLLKSEGSFYGNADGRMNEETISALRRYQISHGLKVTGEIDAETWAALSQSSSPAAQAASPPGITTEPARKPSSEPAAPSPARERARSVTQNDREFLQTIESAPPRPASSPSRDADARTQDASSRPARALPAQTPTEPAGVAPERGESGQIGADEVREFVESYLHAAQGDEPSDEVAHYAGSGVDYFDSGRVDRRFIARDQERYYKRWPQRSFQLLAPPKFVGNSRPGEAVVTFPISYRVQNGRQTSAGKSENAIRVKRFTDGLKIISIRERKIKD